MAHIRIDEVSVNLPHQYYAAIGEFMFSYAQLDFLSAIFVYRKVKFKQRWHGPPKDVGFLDRGGPRLC